MSHAKHVAGCMQSHATNYEAPADAAITHARD